MGACSTQASLRCCELSVRSGGKSIAIRDRKEARLFLVAPGCVWDR